MIFDTGQTAAHRQLSIQNLFWPGIMHKTSDVIADFILQHLFKFQICKDYYGL